MKVNRKQYDKALKDLPKLRKAQEAVQLWTKGTEELPEDRELLEVEESELGFISTTTRKKELVEAAA